MGVIPGIVTDRELEGVARSGDEDEESSEEEDGTG